MSEIETDNMPIHSTSVATIIVKNLSWLLVFIFTPVINYIIEIVPEWKNWLENFKLIGGSLIMVLVITKLMLEIRKIKKDK